MPWDITPTPVGQSKWDFPPPSEWLTNDVVGRGADLEPATVIEAYRLGMFPMVSSDNEISHSSTNELIWWSPLNRGILPLEKFRISKSMRRSAKMFEVRVDTCFAEVMRGCAAPVRDAGWITNEFIDAYVRLHQLGWAHSVEVFDENGLLVGGLYGIRINGLFAGESMFHLSRDASKVALMVLVERMVASRMALLDIQWLTPHLKSLGAISIPRDEYLGRLASSLG